MKKIFKFLGFLIVLCGIIIFAGDLFRIKGDELNESGNTHNVHESFYKLEENSIDVLFVGPSHLYCSISPLDLWKEYGFSSYVMGSPLQRVWQSYCYLEEAFETQSPKVVVLETATLPIYTPQDQAYNHWSIDSMKWSNAKIDSIRLAVNNSYGVEKWMDYIAPSLFYHDRWTDLNSCDYLYFVEKSNVLTRGYNLNTNHIKTYMSSMEYTDDNEAGEGLNSISEEYVNSIKALCDANGAEFLLFKAPTRLWLDSEYDEVKAWADKNEVMYIDFNANDTFKYAADINWDVDSSDGGAHLNYDGAVKTSNTLGAFLASAYELKDRRDEKKKSSWDTDYKFFKQYVHDGKLVHSYNINDYLNAIDKKNFIVCVNTKGYDLSQYEELSDTLKKIGCSPKYIRNSIGTLNMSIVSNGKAYFEAYGTSELEAGEVTYSDTIAEIPFYVSHITDGVRSEFKCYIDKENYANNEPGIQFIVYDKLNKKFVDSVIWVPGDDGVWKKVEKLE